MLIQRELHSYGHKIRDRTWGQVKSDGTIRWKEQSPILFQFLDYCHQLMYEWPKAFEFNEWFLLSPVDALYRGSSNFFFNTEKDYTAARDAGGTAEYWAFVDGEARPQFENPRYDASWSKTHECRSIKVAESDQATGRMVLKDVKAKPGSIIPPTVARVWEAYFNRCAGTLHRCAAH